MKRRELLGGALSAGLVGTAEAREAKEQPPLSDAELEAELDELRRDLAKMDETDDLGFGTRHNLAPNRPDAEAVAEEYEQLLKSTMRTLTIAETLSSLPRASLQDERVVALVGEHAAEMDFAMRGQLATLDRMTAEEKREIRRRLRENPDLAMDIGEKIDRVAGGKGVRRRRRARMKELVKHATWKVQRQPVDTVIDELIDQQARLADNLPSDALERVQRHIDGHSVERWDKRQERLERAIERARAADGDGGAGDDDASHKWKRRAGRMALFGAGCGVLGGVMIGLGLLSDNAVLIIAGLFPVTGLAVFLIIALVFLVIALSKRANSQAAQ